MSKLICKNCGAVIDENELKSVSEEVGEYWGSPAYATYSVCPCCDCEDLEEATECECCGEYFGEEEIYNGVCYECLHSFDNNWKYWYSKCKKHNEKDVVMLNLFLANQFTEEQIEEILYRELEKKEKLQPGSVDCCDFVDTDEDWAADMIKEKENK